MGCAARGNDEGHPAWCAGAGRCSAETPGTRCERARGDYLGGRRRPRARRPSSRARRAALSCRGDPVVNARRRRECCRTHPSSSPELGRARHDFDKRFPKSGAHRGHPTGRERRGGADGPVQALGRRSALSTQTRRFNAGDRGRAKRSPCRRAGRRRAEVRAPRADALQQALGHCSRQCPRGAPRARFDAAHRSGGPGRRLARAQLQSEDAAAAGFDGRAHRGRRARALHLEKTGCNARAATRRPGGACGTRARHTAATSASTHAGEGDGARGASRARGCSERRGSTAGHCARTRAEGSPTGGPTSGLASGASAAQTTGGQAPCNGDARPRYKAQVGRDRT